MREAVEVVDIKYPYLLLRTLLEWHRVYRKAKDTPDLSVENIFPEAFKFINPETRSKILPVLESEIKEWYDLFTELPPANEEVNIWIPRISAFSLEELVDFWKKVRDVLRGEKVKTSQKPGLLFGIAGNIFQFLYPYNSLFLYKGIPNIPEFWRKREEVIVEGFADSIKSMSQEEQEYQMYEFESLYFDFIGISEDFLNLLQKHKIPLVYANGKSAIDQWILSGQLLKEILKHSWFDSLKKGRALPEVYLSLLNKIPEDVIDPEEYIKTAPKSLYRQKELLSLIKEINNWKALKGLVILYYSTLLEPVTVSVRRIPLPDGTYFGGDIEKMHVIPGVIIKILALSLEETVTSLQGIKEKIDDILNALAEYAEGYDVFIVSEANKLLSSDERLEQYYRFYSGYPFMNLNNRKREMESILEYIKHFFYKRNPSLTERIHEGKWLLDLKYADEVHNL